MTIPTHEAHAARHPHGRSPVILMTPDLKEHANGWTEREYVVRANYAEAIREAGGLPLILPYETADLAETLALADGVLITGTTPGLQVLPERRAFEREVVQRVTEAGKPLLGICHGMQLIGEWLGGSFVVGLPESTRHSVEHMPHVVPDRPAHAISLAAGSDLAKLLDAREADVNSLHQHALGGTGRFRVVARALDGVIEAFEGETTGFCLGVQWHPEYRLTAFDRSILRDFVARSAAYKRSVRATAPCMREG